MNRSQLLQANLRGSFESHGHVLKSTRLGWRAEASGWSLGLHIRTSWVRKGMGSLCSRCTWIPGTLGVGAVQSPSQGLLGGALGAQLCLKISRRRS